MLDGKAWMLSNNFQVKKKKRQATDKLHTFMTFVAWTSATFGSAFITLSDD